MNGSVRPSFRPPMSIGPSVTTLCLFCHHRILMKLSGVITNDRSEDHAKCQGHGMEGFWTVSPVWIHCGYGMTPNGRSSIEKVPYYFSRSSVKFQGQTGKNHRFWPELSVSDLYIKFEFTHGFEMMYKAWWSIEEVPYFFSMSSTKFRGKTGQKNLWFWPEFSFSGL